MNVELPRRELDLSSAIAEADIRFLLMVLVHMTGDERWLEPPYKPKRDVRLIPDPDAGLPPEIQDKIRAAVVNLFAHGTPRPVITDPGDELMQRMMRACLGENVAPEYAPMMREEMGFVAREARWSRRPSNQAAGASPCPDRRRRRLRHRARRQPWAARHPLHIVEKNAELGGTWYVNRYPGCGVDTPNHSYSYSFGSRNTWTRYFCRREELLDYLKKVAAEYGIREHLRLNTQLMSSRWDEDKRRWISTLKTAGRRGDFRIHGAGQRHRPAQRSLMAHIPKAKMIFRA